MKKKILLMAAMLLAFACASFGQNLVTDAKPACSTPQIGAYGTYEVAPSSDSSSGYAGQNPVPLGFLLCGTYSKITIEMKTAVPSDKTDGVNIGIFDRTTSTYMDCHLAVGDISCSFTGSTSFTYGDDISFIVYIPGTGHTGYTIQNITWRLE